MAHAHDVWDVDPHFVVDAENRTIIDQSPVGTTLMQYDHNSERLTFEAPLTVDEHDMSKCDRIEIHFINIGSNGKRNADIYPVEDLKIKADDATKVEFTWLVSDKATLYAGSLSFVLRFICETDGKETYRWNSAICSSINVGNGIDNRDSVATQYSDLLSAWYAQFLATGNEHTTEMERIGTTMTELALESYNTYLEALSAETDNAKIELRQTVNNLINKEIGPEYLDATIIPAITTAKTEAIAEINSTAEDIVNVVLSRLPRAEEATF